MLHRLAPCGACGSCACGNMHVRLGEVEFAGGGGEEVEGAERNAAPRSESIASGER
jgi:hypothetical protein